MNFPGDGISATNGTDKCPQSQATQDSTFGARVWEADRQLSVKHPSGRGQIFATIFLPFRKLTKCPDDLQNNLA